MSNPANIPFQLHRGRGSEYKDPLDAGTITVDRTPCVCSLTSATAETRTLAIPTKLGAQVLLAMTADGGDITLTVTGGYNEDGNTTFVFSDPGQFVKFEAIDIGGTLTWRKIADYATGNLSLTEMGWLNGVTAGTGLASKALVLDSSGNVALPAAPASIDQRNAELVITTNVILAAENGRTYYLDLIGGFTSTLPAPALGLWFRFIVKTAPTTAYIITTNAGADILYGMMMERAGGAGVAGAGRDTFNFVASQAKIGDWVEFYSDGTNWYYRGMVDVAAGNTVAQS